MMKKQFASTMAPGSVPDSASVMITLGSAGGPANVVATAAGTVKVLMGGKPVPL
jgi:gamma-glutamyltranspeptidase